MMTLSRQSAIIPLASPRRDLERYQPELAEATRRVFDSGVYIGGAENEQFEAELAAATETAACAGVASGTDALILALQAAGVSAGDEVIAPSHTAGPSVAAINCLGATPVLVDVEYDTACLAPGLAEQAIGPKTKAILLVHLYGQPGQLDRFVDLVDRHNLILVEDCAQAQGATFNSKPVGSFGTFGCFSFYPTKNLGAIGDGGAVVGSRERVDLVRQLSVYGWKTPQLSEIANGRCSRLDTLQAAFLRLRLKGLARDVNARRRTAKKYLEGMAGLAIALPQEQEGSTHAYHLFVIKTDRRDALRDHLARQEIMCGIHYPFPVHVQPGLNFNSRLGSSMDVTSKLQREILSLPMFATLSDTEVSRVIDEVRRFFRSAR